MSFADVSEVEKWTQTLMECKQLSEAEVKKLCEKVIYNIIFLNQYTILIFS